MIHKTEKKVQINTQENILKQKYKNTYTNKTLA